MNSLSSSRKENIAKQLARAVSLPAELSRYSKNCKLLCNILRDTKHIINEINTADYLARGNYCEIYPLWKFIIYGLLNAEEIVNLRISPSQLQGISESVDKPISLVVLGFSNIARAILVNQLIGGKPFFPVPVVSPPISIPEFFFF